MTIALINLLMVIACLSAAASNEVRFKPQTNLKQTHNLRPEVFELALEAYEQAIAGGHVRRPVLTIIDYELPSYRSFPDGNELACSSHQSFRMGTG